MRINGEGVRTVPLLFLDVDGTVRHGKDELGAFVNSPDQVHIFPEAIKEMEWWKRRGGKIIGVSNQGGIALEYMTMQECAMTMDRTNELTGYLFDLMIWCPHHPSAEDPIRKRCWCRKPMPGLPIEARTRMVWDTNFTEMYPMHLSILVGDRDEDRDCAANANLDFMWADAWRSGMLRETAFRSKK